MSWLARLFGAGSSASPSTPAAPKPTAEIEHRGFTIRAEPYRNEDGQFQTAGTVVRVVDGVAQEHRFVRADRFASLDDATAIALQKGRQIVDEGGERLFAKAPGPVPSPGPD